MNGVDSLGWNDQAWKEINDAIQLVVGETSVTTSGVFPIQLLPGASNVLDQKINTGPPLSMDEGTSKSFIKIREQFVLTKNQVDMQLDPKVSDHVATTLAMLVAATLGQVTDGLIFLGQNFNAPGGVTVERKPSDTGLFGIAGDEVKETVAAGQGQLIFDAVVKALALLNQKGIATTPNQCALFLESAIFAEAQAPLGNIMVTPASSIAPLVTKGFFATSALSPKTGLLVSVAGDPTDLAIRDPATATLLQQEGDGYHFEVSQSFQYIAKDPRTLVRLLFS